MRKFFLLIGIIYFVFYFVLIGSQENWQKVSNQNYNLYYKTVDSNKVNVLETYLENGIKIVQKYFDKSFEKKFDVYVFPSRQELDLQWAKDWNISGFKSECWMVASGVAHRLDILSINRWKQEACEHNPDDIDATQKIITHELVHVFQGQNNPIPDFTGMDDLGWFVEGLAVLVAGQVDSTRINDLKAANEQNKLPLQLKNFWSGKYRYSFSGSLVQYIESKYGAATISKLLKCTKQSEILDLLRLTEDELISDWKKFINR